MGGVESNPGPGTGRSVAFGSLNARSAVKKGALIRDLIETHNLDILAVCETWFNSDDPNAIKLDMAPPGYLTKNLTNSIPGRVGRCGGLALIHRDNLTVRPHSVIDSVLSTSFHYQAFYYKTFCIINTYRWPDSNLTLFYNELSDLLSEILVSVDSDRLLICGDFNCSGTTQCTVADQLSTVLDSFGLYLHVEIGTNQSHR